MMGNIWEWTSSIPQEYPFDPKEGRDTSLEGSRRILRGGSLLPFPNVVARDYDPEDACYFNDGFRVVLQ